jgi:hypothetical protein
MIPKRDHSIKKRLAKNQDERHKTAGRDWPGMWGMAQG